MKLKLNHVLLGVLIAATSAATANEFRTVNGARYVSDSSIPSLGRAVRDSRGLVWGEYHRAEISLAAATQTCEQLGARLPTRNEVIRMARSFGADSSHRYQPLTSDGQEVITGLNSNGWNIWTSTTRTYGGDGLFDEDTGILGYLAMPIVLPAILAFQVVDPIDDGPFPKYELPIRVYSAGSSVIETPVNGDQGAGVICVSRRARR